MRDPKERLLDTLDAIERIEKYVSKGRAAFEQDELIQTWVVHHLQIVGEAAANIFSWSDPAPFEPRYDNFAGYHQQEKEIAYHPSCTGVSIMILYPRVKELIPINSKNLSFF
jgi:hypothetical protein